MEQQSIAHLKLLYDISRTLIAGGSLQDLLTRLLDRTVSVTCATRGSIIVLHHELPGQGLVIRAGAGIASPSSDIERVLRDGAAGHAIATRQAIVVYDVRQDPRWVPSTIDVASESPRSALVVPLIHNTTVVGVMTLWHVNVGYFTPDLVDVINAVAAHAAVAIERAIVYERAQQRAEELARSNRQRDQLYMQERQRRLELSHLYEATLDISKGDDLNHIATRLASQARWLIAADSAWVYLWDVQQGDLALAQHDGAASGDVKLRIAIGECLVGQAAALRQVVSSADVNADGLDSAACCSYLGAAMAVPLLCGESLQGVVVVARLDKTHTFSEQEITLLNMLGAQAAVSLANARLYIDLQRINDELTAANRLKSEFLAMVSHELRTPLHSISGYTEMLLEGFYGPLSDLVNDPLNRIQRNAQHLTHMISDVLDLSMIESGHVQIAREPYDLVVLAREVCFDAARNARAQGLDLQTEIIAELPLVIGDERRIRQVIEYLLDNAIKFTERGCIKVRVFPLPADTADADRRRMVCIEVADTGIGIPEDFQEVIFEAFRQVDSSSTRRFDGAGLGLTIISRLVRLMGGSVEVSSEVDVGSTFRVLIPLSID